MVMLNTDDLSHILNQIKIAEAHTQLMGALGPNPTDAQIAAALATLVASPLMPFGLRTVDGSFNNFLPGMERFGSSDQVMDRLLTPNYGDAGVNINPFDPNFGNGTSYTQTSGDVYDTEPRTISNLVADQTLNNPAAIAAALAAGGVTGVEALTIVNEILAAHRAALQERAEAVSAGVHDATAEAAAADAVAAAESGAQTADDALSAAEAAKAGADAALTDATQALADAQAALDALPAAGDVPAAQAAVDSATAALAVTQDDATAADAALAAATSALAAADLALIIATARRDMAQEIKVEADAGVAAAQGEVAEAQAALDGVLAGLGLMVEEVAEQLADAQTTYDSNVAFAESIAAELALAQAALDAAVADQSAAQDAHDLALADQALAGDALVQALIDLDAAQAALNDAAGDPVVQAAYDAAVIAFDAATTAAADADQAVVDALATLQAAQAAMDTATTDHAGAQTANDAAQAPLAGLAAALAAAQADADAVTAATDAVQAAEAELAGQEGSAALMAVVLARAETALTNATANLTAAEAAHAAAAAQASAAQGALTAAQALLATAQAALDGVTETDAARAAAEAALDAAEAAHDAAVTEAQSAADALTGAQTAATEAETALTDAQSALDALAAPRIEDAEAVQAEADLAALLEAHGITMDGDNVLIPNVDTGLAAPFSGFFTIFGQFFDHGLDLTAKGGAGNVIIPLQPDDPLYVVGSRTNFMVLTRATNDSIDPGADGLVGTADDIRNNTNETTPWIDLNQVYTSNPSHQVFLREYVLDSEGRPVATGQMLEGEAGGPPTWADVKAQAANLLGIQMSDLNATSVPLLVTDLYGEFVRGDNGLPLLMTATGPIEGNLANPVDAMTGLSAGRAFLNDIAHAAAPKPGLVADADDVAGGHVAAGQYDDELLGQHFIVGDGRGNENIALTATHTIFHSEHNRQVEAIKATVLAPNRDGVVDLAFLNEWLSVPVTELPTDLSSLIWDGERLFQAARFSTEMVYQHLVFEEFARTVAPDIDPFVFSNTVGLDPAISQEFAQVVYRFGHSMLNENVQMLNVAERQVVDTDGNPVFDAEGAPVMEQYVQPTEMGLIEAFLNPQGFINAGGALNPAGETVAHVSAGAILRGMTTQIGNEIDEFVTSALRDNLVGLPLDLAALNIARARDTGIPSLNEARRQLFESTNDTALKPYDNWFDFAANLKTPLSIVNFIAAYGTHDSLTQPGMTLEQKREAAMNLVFQTADSPADRLDFLNSTGTWAGTESGLNDVDFWIGGLAESLMAFGGKLGSTFTAVFELHMENLQAGDRFYYLSRTQGMNLLSELEGDSFAELIRRNTDTEYLNDELGGLHIGSAFKAAEYAIEMNQNLQYNAGLGSLDPTDPNNLLNPNLVIRQDTNGDTVPDYLRFMGDQHVILGGTHNGETIIGGAGDDVIWGEGGNDYLEGGRGVDHIDAGAGNDIITDSGTDLGAADVLKGGDGDDIINGGMGLDLIFGGNGKDVLVGGSEAKDLFGGQGDDFIRAPSGAGVMMGNEGDDWIEGAGMMGTLTGDSSQLFFNSRIIGHDIMFSGPNDGDFDGETGDDIMVQSLGVNRNNGMAGFDWVTHQDAGLGVDANMNVGIFVNQEANILRDRFDLVEGLSGSAHDDRLTGRNVARGAADPLGNAAQAGATDPVESFSNTLLEKNLDLIDGLRDLVQFLMDEREAATGSATFDVYNTNQVDGAGNPTGQVLQGVMNTADGSDIILAGAGSDTMAGMSGNDILDGDKTLNVFIAILDGAGNLIGTASRLTAQVLDATGEALFGGLSLESLLFARTIAPNQLEARRQITNEGEAGDVDVATFWDVADNYTITVNADGSLTVTHDTATAGAIDPQTGRPLELEGTDHVSNVEILRFGDGVEIIVQDLLNEPPVITSASTVSVTENGAAALTVTATDANGDVLTYSISGGADAALFTIDAATGALTFNAAPNFEAPGDAGADNVYDVTVSVSDGVASVDQLLAVTVTNADEAGSGTVTISDATPTQGQAMTMAPVTADPDGIVTENYQWQRSTDGGATWVNVGAATAAPAGYTPTATDGESLLRATVTVTDGAGAVTTWASAASAPVGRLISTNAATINGTAGADGILGGFGSNTINGGAGDDTVNGGLGNDSIRWTAGGGRDVINGSLGTDTFIATGSAAAETFTIYAVGNSILVNNAAARADLATALGGAPALATGTEIVITRTVGGVTSIIAELDNVEEIAINTLNTTTNNGNGTVDGGPTQGDTVVVRGNFGLFATSLNYSTITVVGSDANDTVDVTGLESDHRVVLDGQGGQDAIVGGTRPQDILVGPDGLPVATGDHVVQGGEGDDVFVKSGTAINHFYGAEGSDTIDYSGIDRRIVVRLGDDEGETGDAWTATNVDWLDSIENVIGSGRADAFHAGEGVNVITGGGGRDMFRFGSADDADGDVITDFAVGDRIHLSQIDADEGARGNNGFTLAGEGQTPAAGLLAIEEVETGVYLLQGHTDDDGQADFTLTVHATRPLTAGDIIL